MLSRIGNSSVLFGAVVCRSETLLVSGELVYVFANPSTQTSLQVAAQLRTLLQGFEAGKPMLYVRLGTSRLLEHSPGAAKIGHMSCFRRCAQPAPAERVWTYWLRARASVVRTRCCCTRR